MENMENSEAPKLKWAAAVVIIAVLVLGGYLYFKYRKGQTTVEGPATLGGQVADQIQNPTDKMPDANPYNTKTNPFEAKANPFKDVYQNPFK